MTIVSILLCDYCAREIKLGDSWTRLSYTLSPGRPASAEATIADYHLSCWRKMKEAIRLAQDVGGGLEQIHVATDYAIRKLRLQHLPEQSASGQPGARPGERTARLLRGLAWMPRLARRRM